MLVVGTAGHIDHGKSAIVKQLTGSDPDRLPEEKLRGMTIDLGFAFRGDEDNQTIAFVDVPGHERFVKNMIAGVGGIDVVMLVIAADDGWMPQSQEHFQIVRLLGIKNGLIVINKIDLAEADWLDMLEEDVREKVSGTFLAEAPMFRVSAQTGAGFEQLGVYLDGLAGQLTARRDIGKARLYIDRSFVLTGIGGVVTGTLRGGGFSVGQTVGVWPSGVSGKVRSLHANNSDVSTAEPGQRTALTLTGVDKENLTRGGVITDRLDHAYFTRRPVLALSVELLPEAMVSLADRRRILFITGTTELEGEIRILGSKEIKPAESAIVFFRPDQPVYTLVGDRFVIRLPTPMVTLGGGLVLDHLTRFPYRRESDRYDYLKTRLSGSGVDLVLTELTKTIMADSKTLLEHSTLSSGQISAAVKALTKDSLVDSFEDKLFHVEHLNGVMATFEENSKAFLKSKPHLKGLTRDQVGEFSGTDRQQTADLVDWLIHIGKLVKLGDRYNLVGRGMSLKGNIKTAHDEIIAQLKDQPHTPPRLAVLAKEGKDHREAIKFIIESGEGYKCGSEFLFLSDAWQEIVTYIKTTLGATGQLIVSDLKEKFGMSRKFAIPILEETDRLKLTDRDGDIRVKGDRFDN
ncbi:MAG: selenocysteine-specific translation elongation factor [candidate division Zixibacteria bacterium]|nr:selenocysteine-specific translation elongation factor [candidate division Zixibacteria bacterium]MDH3937294.1 selenocysteine-specific translation elongation factor [candidate division Zixibacteria bacterium]MDH4034346.1 selenocysteine-specific translation elongation factor [candidate division Zixibacteria bacterium]